MASSSLGCRCQLAFICCDLYVAVRISGWRQRKWQLFKYKLTVDTSPPPPPLNQPPLQGNDSWFSVRGWVLPTAPWVFLLRVSEVSSFCRSSRCWTRFLICIAWPGHDFTFHKLLCSCRWRHRINIPCPQVVPSATRTPAPPWKPINSYEL